MALLKSQVCVPHGIGPPCAKKCTLKLHCRLASNAQSCSRDGLRESGEAQGYRGETSWKALLGLCEIAELHRPSNH